MESYSEEIHRTESKVSDFPAQSEFQEVLKSVVKGQLKEETGMFFVKACDALKDILEDIISNPTDENHRVIHTRAQKFSENIGKYPSGHLILEMIGFIKIEDANPYFYFSNQNIQSLREAVKVLETAQIKSQRFEIKPKTDPEVKLREVQNKNRELEDQMKEYRNKQRNQFVGKGKVPTAPQPAKAPPVKTSPIKPVGKSAATPHTKNAAAAKPSPNPAQIKFPSNPVAKFPVPAAKNPLSGNVPPADFTANQYSMLNYAHLYVDPNLDSMPGGPRVEYDIEEQEQKAFQLTNEYRAGFNLPELAWHEQLWAIAAEHSKNMANGSVPFGHEGFGDRFKRFPFVGAKKGAENVGYYFGPQEPCVACVNGIINSPGHQKNLVGNFKYIGIAAAVNSKGFYYFTQLFAFN